MNWETLLSFGDSITFGARSYLGYPEICGEILQKQLDKQWNVINHSTNGFTTIDLVRSLNPVMESYKNAYPSIISVMIGTNDIKNKVSLDNFQVAYRQLIVKLRLLSVNNNVVLLKIPPFTKKVFYPYHYSMNDQVHTFNQVIESLGAAHNLRCFGVQLDEEDFFDGVHLSEKGCNTVAKQLSDLILKDKGIESTPGLS